MDATHESEQWKDIPGFEGYYEVSDYGGVRSLGRTLITKGGIQKNHLGKRLKPTEHKQLKYLFVTLCKDGERRSWKVHQLVALAFIGPRPAGSDTCHNNDIRTDNRAVNLRYDTHSANALDHVRAGNHYETKRTECPRGHLLCMPNLPRKKWEQKGHRCCLACSRASNRIYKRPELRPQFDEIADQNYRRIMSKATARRDLT